MDSLTHIALGACIGELVAGKQLGKKALAAGAIAQSIPDIDFIASFWLSPARDLLAHRGFTHSIFFVFIIAYPLALIITRQRWIPHMSIRAWTIFLIAEMFIHLFLDSFNAYGTGLFEPFNSYRVSFHTLFVIDPVYSFPIGIAALLLLVLPASNPRRIKWAKMGIVISSIYIMLALANKALIQQTIRNSLESQNIQVTRYFSTPTPGNIWLWYIVAETEEGFAIAYSSVFDLSRTLTFHRVERNDELLTDIDNNEDLQRLIRFSQGYYAITKYNEKLVFNDLRFGQMMGWDNPNAPFVFYYFVDGSDNDLIIQRGRFAKWDLKSVGSFVRRIFGMGHAIKQPV